MGIGKSLELAGVEGTQGSFAHTICKMVNNQMLFRVGNNRRANFSVNYMHKDIPGYVLEKMPDGARSARRILEEELEKNQHIDDVGCVVTEPEPESEPEPEIVGEPAVLSATMSEPETDPEPVENPYEKMQEYVATAERVEEPVAPTQMSVSSDNGEIKISLTLNINVNR